ncbi:VKc domain-containing protein [Haematococcus lacustris]|uniref:VKc domain-containing protein n=1 Tax=Haematococcus lacustris TaxID=44745 RepID=A0A699ZIF5_HAELA|nr:VKc domain-containing protein [Haematococcus lacustris]
MFRPLAPCQHRRLRSLTVKLAGDTPYCPVSGCDSVLTSSYSELYGVPLSALGYILATQFPGQSCAWCYASVGLSYALAASLLRSLPGRALGQVALPGLGALAGVAVLLAVGFGPLASSTAGEDFQLPYQAPEVLTASSPQAVSLARRLRDAGARMYGAFWCSHCFDQKQAFGSAAMADFPYVECYPEGWQRGAQVAPACEAAGVRAFPTWVINGRLLEGELTLDSLEQELGNLDSTAPPKLLPESPFKEQ